MFINHCLYFSATEDTEKKSSVISVFSVDIIFAL